MQGGGCAGWGETSRETTAAVRVRAQTARSLSADMLQKAARVVAAGKIIESVRSAHITGGSKRAFAVIAPRTCQLLELRSAFSEGAYIDCLQIEFENLGELRGGEFG